MRGSGNSFHGSKEVDPDEAYVVLEPMPAKQPKKASWVLCHLFSCLFTD